MLIEIKLYKNGYPFKSSISFYRSKGRGDCRVSISEVRSIAHAGEQILFTIEDGQLVCEKIVV